MYAANLYRGHLIKCKRFIVGKAARRKRDPRTFLVAINYLVSLHDAVKLAAAAVECWYQRPSQILVGIADVSQLPVENRGNVAVLLQEISDAVIAVNDCPPWRCWAVFVKPLAGPIQQRIIPIERPG